MDQEVELDGIIVAAHELKAPLAVLRQLALSLDSAESPASERIKSQMVSVSERAIRQVNDLTKIRRLEDGLFTMEPVSVRPVCDEVIAELSYLFHHQHRGLSIKYASHLPLATANRELLYSVVYNFLLNAMHYSTGGTEARLAVKNAGDKIKISIRDYGPALPTEIWRALQRGTLDHPTSIAMRPGSSGLGLFIASKFSRYMHAEVGAVRHRDGTSFYVALPRSQQLSLF